MSVGLYSGTSGLALGVGLWSGVPGFWSGAAGLIDGLGAALDLNFLAGAPLDSRITFSRGSNATLTDSTGKITYAPNNLITNSQDFESANWSKTSVTVSANTTAAPDGTTTADTLTAAAGTVSPLLSFNTVITAIPAVASFYVKAGTYGIVQISNEYGGGFYANFDLTNGVVGSKGAGCTASSITAVGGGWYRCSAAFTSFDNCNLGFVGSTTATRQQAFTAAGTETVFVWGAQLEAVTYQTTPSTYNSTTPKNLLGYTQEFDNAAWTKSNAFVQTNLLTNSEQFDNAAWVKGGATVTANSTTSPDGTVDADTLTEDTSTGDHRTFQTVTVSNATAYAFSVFIKPNGRSLVTLTFAGVGDATYNVLTGVVTNTGSGTAEIQNAGNGWYRCILRFTTATTSYNAQIRLVSTGTTTSYTGNGTSGVFLWGAQLVQGADAGNYQPTYAAAAAVQYAAPDGTLSADKLVENTATASHHTFSGPTATVASTPYTASVYLKAGERRYAIVGYRSSATNIAWAAVVVDLLTGTVGTPTVAAGASNVSASISDAGNGWYRVRITATITAADGQLIVTLSDVASPTISNYVVYSYTGDGTSGIYVWGAQLSNSASLDTYAYNPGAAPTSAAYYGPRFDYDPVTLAPKGLLIEEQRTNLLLRSEEFGNGTGWPFGTGTTVSANAIGAPDGNTTADKIAEDSSTGVHERSCSFTFVSGTSYAYSVFVKAAERTRIQIGAGNPATWAAQAIFDVSNGTIVSTGAGTASITSFGNGWYRCTVAGSALASAATSVLNLLVLSGTTISYTGVTGSGLYLWGAQLEAGAFATSYIPTVASTVTRSADVASMVGTNFSSWYNQSAGTFVADFDTVALRSGGVTTHNVANANDGTANNIVSIFASANFVAGQVLTGGVTQAYIQGGGSPANNVPIKLAIGYATNDVAVTANGAVPSTDTSATMPTGLTQLSIGSFTGFSLLNGHIRSISYFNTRLPNATLQSLTA